MDKRVKVRFFAAARAAAGVDTASFDTAPLSNILAEACHDNPTLAHVLAQCSFLIDSLAVHDLEVHVKNGSTVDVLPRFAGG